MPKLQFQFSIKITVGEPKSDTEKMASLTVDTFAEHGTETTQSSACNLRIRSVIDSGSDAIIDLLIISYI